MLVSALLLTIITWAYSPAQVASTSDKSNVGTPTVSENAPASTEHYLTTAETITAPAEAATGFTKLDCDADGNLYLGAESPGALAIRKLNPKGERIAVYEPGANPDVKIWNAGDYSLTKDGELYVWVGAKDEITRYVLVFKSDGSYKERIKLEPGFPWLPASLAVFPNGELLMTGQAYVKETSRPMLPFTGIFASNGKLLKEINLEDDVRVHDLAAAHDSHVVSSVNPTSNRAVAWGRMAAAKDGNIYVMRWLSPAEFYAISPGGEVIRRFTVDPGKPDYMPIQMHIAGNRIAVLFAEHQTLGTILKVVDLEGNELESFEDARIDGKPKHGPIGLAFACYSLNPEIFKFLTTDDEHRIQIRSVVGR